MESIINKKKIAIKSNHIFVDSTSDPVAGYLVIASEKVEKLVTLSSLDNKKKQTKFLISHEIVDYSGYYLTPGLIDLNMTLNSTFKEDWCDISNTTKQALSGGVTTIIDTLLLTEGNIKAKKSDQLQTDNDGDISILDEIDMTENNQKKKEIITEQEIPQRINSIKRKTYCDCGFLGNLHSKNFPDFKILFEDTSNSLLGYKVNLAPSQSPGEPYLHRRHIEKMLRSVASLKKKNILLSINSVAGNGRDLFLPSPCRSRPLEKRVLLSENIGDYSNFGGGINGAEKNGKNQEESDAIREHKYDLFQEGFELDSAELRHHSKRLAQYNEENNISRMEMLEYNYAPEHKDERHLPNLNETFNKIEGINTGTHNLNLFSFTMDDSETEIDNFEETIEDAEKPEKFWGKYHKSICLPSKNKFDLSETKKTEETSLELVTNKEIPYVKSQSQNLMAVSIAYNHDNKINETNSENLNKHKFNKKGLILPGNLDQSRESLLTMKSPLLTPSRLIQRREMTLSMQSPGIQSNRSMFSLTTDRRITKNSELEKRKSRNYQCYISVFPLALETNGIDGFIKALKNIEAEKSFNKGSQIKLLFTNLSCPHLLYLLREAKKTLKYFQLYSDTSASFLHFYNEKIKDGETIFKSCPPIREKHDRELMVKSLILGAIDCVSSFHNQVPYGYKFIDEGNFRRAFSGLSNVGCNLQVVWTRLMIFKKMKEKSIKKAKEGEAKIGGLEEIHQELKKYVKILISTCSETPAKILNINHKKGTLKTGMHADFVVWKPLEIRKIKNPDIFLSYRDVYIMRNQKFFGDVKATYLRGNLVFERLVEGGVQFSKQGIILENEKFNK